MIKKEAQHQSKIKRSFDHYCNTNNIEGHYWKIPDTGFLCPYDCYFLTNKGFTALELKYNRAKNTMNFYSLFGRGKQYHEIRYLLKVRKCGHKSWVCVIHKKSNGHHTAYLFDPYTADEFFLRRKGIKMEEIIERSIELDRVKNDITRESVYDLAPLF